MNDDLSANAGGLLARPEPRSENLLAGKRVWVAGHRGMVGSALIRRLARENCALLTCDRAEVDLARQAETEAFVKRRKPDVVLVAAALVGGIMANLTRPAEFLYQNLMISANVIDAARQGGVGRLIYLGSSCIYPRDCTQPMLEMDLLSGPLERTNEAYAVAKIAGLKMVQAYNRQHSCSFTAVLPPNLYGPGDNYDLESAHVLPALMRKIHQAKTVGLNRIEIWGSGRPLREFMHVDDVADACVFLLNHLPTPDVINIGTGEEISIEDLACLIADVVGYAGAFNFDRSKPDGTPRKLLDTSQMNALGWRGTIGLREGLKATYENVCGSSSDVPWAALPRPDKVQHAIATARLGRQAGTIL